MSDKKNEKKASNLQDEFNKIQEINKDLDVGSYLATRNDLPGLGEIDLYDYNKDIRNAQDSAEELLDSLVDMYLGDAPEKYRKYVEKKKKEDAKIYAKSIFLTDITEKTYITQLRQIDNGDNNAKMHEVLNQTVREMRENIKFSKTHRTELEAIYKELRRDMGLEEMENKDIIALTDQELTDKLQEQKANLNKLKI